MPGCSLEMAVGSVGEYRLGGSASWDEYVEKLEMYCAANKLTTDEEKRAVLLSCCGEETYSLIVTLVKPARPTATSFDSIVQAVKGHLHPSPSELYARFLFYKRNQAATETVAEYVTALRKLAEDCGFSDKVLPLNVMMRARFVCGISNGAIQQRLLAERELSFETAYDFAVTAEATAKQQKDIGRQRHDETAAEATQQVTQEVMARRGQDQQCYRCAGKHNSHNCKFKTEVCFKCNKTGHIARACQ